VYCILYVAVKYGVEEMMQKCWEECTGNCDVGGYTKKGGVARYISGLKRRCTVGSRAILGLHAYTCETHVPTRPPVSPSTGN